MHADTFRTKQASTMGARPAPQPQPQLRARRVRGVGALRRGAAAAASQPVVRASKLPDGILTDLQRGPGRSGAGGKPAYLPHEVLRATMQLVETRSDNDAPTPVHISCEPMAALLAHSPALLGCGAAEVRHTHAHCYVVTLEGNNECDASASQTAGDDTAAVAALQPPQPRTRREEAAPAQRRLLRLLDAVEAAAPDVLCGSAHTKRTSMRALARRTCTLAAFAAHVPDDAWVHAPETWTPRKSHGLAQQVRSLFAHVVGARFAVPSVLYKTFEAWHTIAAAGGADGDCEDLRRRFTAVFLAAARGGSIRDALRAQFPTMCISREAAHLFAAPRRIAYCSMQHYPTPLSRAYDTPFGQLRCAQMRALGLEREIAEHVAWHILPPAPCADAGGEQLLLDAVRFLVQRGLISTARWPDAGGCEDAGFMARVEVVSNAHAQLRRSPVLADVGFFLHSQLRAAEARGQPLTDAFSLSGRTLTSLACLAAQHRRDALVPAAAAIIVRGGSFVDVGDLAGVWRAPLSWDEGCEQALALRCAGGVLALKQESRWTAPLRYRGKEASGSDRNDSTVSTLRGEWWMQRLNTSAAICKEGLEQHNCLRREDGRHRSRSRNSSYWSFRFTPDAAGTAQLEADEQLRRSAAQLRLTVHIVGNTVFEALARDNQWPPLAAHNALAAWGQRASVLVPRYYNNDDDDEPFFF